jgi:hypothetical protein
VSLFRRKHRCHYCGNRAIGQSRVDGNWRCGTCSPCWCDYCTGRIGVHGPEAVALYREKLKAAGLVE